MSKSRLSNLNSGKWITPGTAACNVISTASREGVAASILTEAAKATNGMRIQRCFDDKWVSDGNGGIMKEGVVKFHGGERPLTIKLGVEDGLILRETDGVKLSLKPIKTFLEVGRKRPETQFVSSANMLVASWLVHGYNWMDRNGRLIRRPYGDDRRGHKDEFAFQIIDGAKGSKTTLHDLICRGCVRSTHVGEWQKRHSTLIPAVCGMPVRLHEFKMAGGADICELMGLQIGADSKVWGPYCNWIPSVRTNGNLGMWENLAQECSSPFAFHLHATRTLFEKCQLDSNFLLYILGTNLLGAILEEMAHVEPERFYRLIDGAGATHRLTDVRGDVLYYGDHHFRRSDIPANIIGTFQELETLQYDSGYIIKQGKPRIVLDPHAYIVIEALAAEKDDVCVLSGREMYRYLVSDDEDALMHQIRNDRLFTLLCKYFNREKIRFHVYPPLTWDGLVYSQYDDLGKCPKSAWLSQQLEF